MLKISVYNFFFFIILISLVSTELKGQEPDDSTNRAKEYLKKKYEREFGDKPTIPDGAPITNRSNSEFKITAFSDEDIVEAEPTIAVNPTNPDNIVVSFIHFGLDSRQSIYHTFDAGETWTRTVFRMDSLFLNDFVDIAVVDRGGADPVLAFDKTGKLYYVWLYSGLGATNNFLVATYWAWSDDGGVSFQVAEEKYDRLLAFNDVSTFEGAFFDKPWLAVDKTNGDHSGTVYLQVFAFVNENHIIDIPLSSSIVLYKTPDMITFDSYEVVLDDLVPVSDGIAQLQFANVYVDQEGVLHSSTIGYASGGIGSNKIYHCTSSNASQSFSDLISASDVKYDGEGIISSGNPMPDAVTNPVSGTVHMIYGVRDLDGESGQYHRSSDGGATWTAASDLGSTIGAGSTEMFFPSIAVDEVSGRISIAYMGRDSDVEWNYYVTSSTDDGATWDEPCLVSTLSSNFQNFSQMAFFGDYWETKLVGDKTYCVWNDFREGFGLKMYVAVVDHLEEISEVSRLPINLKF